jgi:phospholipid transport system transporter-binding protein
VTREATGDAGLEAAGSGSFSLRGDVTFTSAGALLEAGRQAFAGLPAVTVDLGQVTRVDSAGLALLLEWLRLGRAESRATRFTALPDKLLAIARLTGVDGLLTEGYSVTGVEPGPGSSNSSSSNSTSSR